MLFVIIICCVNGVPIVKGKGEDLTYVASSPTYVSKLGSDGDDDDATFCGSQSLPCKTFAHAVQRAFEETAEDDTAEVVIDVGVFMETEEILLTGALDITGVDQTACFLTLPNDPSNSHRLFRVDLYQQTAWLRFFNITILLANGFLETYSNCYEDCNRDYTIIFQQCCITRESNVVDASYSIRVSYISVKFESCTVYNSTTTTQAALPFFYSESMYSLCVTNSSFANINVNIIPTTTRWLSTANGGCFRTNDIQNFTLSQCIFVACSCGDSFRSAQKGGLGAVAYISHLEEGLIRSCVFSNTSAVGNFGGVIYIQYGTDLSIEDTSCIRCHAQHGGAFRISIVSNVTIYNCSFTNCFSNYTDGGGGALSVHMNSHVVIRHCSFVNCLADFGGALHVEDYSEVYVEDSVFIGNFAGDDFNGNDIYGKSGVTVAFNSEAPSYTDNQEGTPSVQCISDDDYVSQCGQMLQFTGYSGTCSGTYMADRCDVPCAADRITKTCVKLNACPEGYFPILGVCEPICLYFDASGSGGSFACTSPCVRDDSLKYPLCASGVVPCAERTMNASAPLPCWSVDCYWDQGNAEPNKCVEEETDCTNKNHFTKGPINYICSLLDCDLRTANSSEKWPCGKATGESPSCFQDIGGPEQNACVTSCTNANHYENTSTGEGSATDTGKCTVLSCEKRTKNGTGESPCGTECYVNLVDGGSDCTRCLNEKLHEKEPSGTCSWKPCSSREADESMGNFPCGPEACYADSNRNGECHPDCALSAHYEESKVTGRCELKACAKRKGNTSDAEQQQLPCGTDDCFLDLSLDPSGATCGAECTNSTYYTEDSMVGRCEKKDCAVGIGPLLCNTAPWCVVTEESPRECLETCRNPTLFTVSPEEDVEGSTYRTCVPKTCADIGVAHCTQAVWCVVTETETVTGDAASASACRENCSDPLNFEVSKERDPKNPLYGKCVRKDRPEPNNDEEQIKSKSSLSGGQIVGLVVGVGVAVMAVAVGAVAGGVYFVLRRQKMSAADKEIQESLSVNSEPPSDTSGSSNSDLVLRQHQQEIENEESK